MIFYWETTQPACCQRWSLIFGPSTPFSVETAPPIVVSRGQYGFNWFSFSLRLLLRPQRLSMGTANWPSPVATRRRRQTWPRRHFFWPTGTMADKRFPPAMRLCGTASLETTVWCLSPSPSGHHIYCWTDQDHRDSMWFFKDSTAVCSDWFAFVLWGQFESQTLWVSFGDISGNSRSVRKVKLYLHSGSLFENVHTSQNVGELSILGNSLHVVAFWGMFARSVWQLVIACFTTQTQCLLCCNLQPSSYLLWLPAQTCIAHLLILPYASVLKKIFI